MALLQTAAGVFVYLTFALQQDVVRALAAALAIVAATWPLLFLFAEERERRSVSVVLVYIPIGVALPGVVALLAMALEVSRAVAVFAYLAVVYAAVLVRFGIRRANAAVPDDATGSEQPASAAALALCVIGCAPTLVYAIYMGAGAYPAVFFNVDNTYHLTHAWSLLSEPGYPIMSLGVYGERRIYQYGGQSAAALLSAATGLPPHTAYLGLMFPFFKLGAAGAAWQVGRGLWPALPLWMTAGLLVVFSRFPLDIRELAAPWWALNGSWPSPPPLNLFDIDHALTNFGMFAVLAVLAYAAGGSRSLRFPAIAALALLPMFKMSFFLSLGAAFGAWSAVIAVRRRSVAPLAPGLIALVMAVAIAEGLKLRSGETAGGLVISPFAQLRDLFDPIGRRISGALGESSRAATLRSLRGTIVEYALVFHWVIAGACAALLGWRRGGGWRLEWIAMAAAPLVFMNLFKYVRGPVDTESLRSSIYTTFNLLPYLVLVAALHFASDGAARGGGRRRGPGLILGAYAGYFSAAHLCAVVTLAAAPWVGYEHADNGAIAEALRAIPRDGALVVTNDTRYPSTNFAPTDLQLQIPAIYGHRAYFVDGVNDKFEVAAARRVHQERLRLPVWDDELPALATAEGWTHLLVRRDAPHPAVIPLRRVFQNRDYIVYSFLSPVALPRSPSPSTMPE